jgi:hypothetical protein
MEGPINTNDAQDNGLGLNIERATNEEAQEVEQSTGSKYAPLAEEWREARADGEALILRGLDKSRVGSIRSFMYRTFEKEDMIVRSKQQSDGEVYNVTIRERQNGEYLSDEETTDEETTDEEETYVASDVEEAAPSVEETLAEDKEEETNQYAMSAK